MKTLQSASNYRVLLCFSKIGSCHIDLLLGKYWVSKERSEMVNKKAGRIDNGLFSDFSCNLPCFPSNLNSVLQIPKPRSVLMTRITKSSHTYEFPACCLASIMLQALLSLQSLAWATLKQNNQWLATITGHWTLREERNVMSHRSSLPILGNACEPSSLGARCHCRILIVSFTCVPREWVSKFPTNGLYRWEMLLLVQAEKNLETQWRLWLPLGVSLT